MTRKDYKLLAEALRLSQLAPLVTSTHIKGDRRRHAYKSQYLQTCESVAALLGVDNPRFDAALFLTACGVGVNSDD